MNCNFMRRCLFIAILVMVSANCYAEGLWIREENVPSVVPPKAKYSRFVGGSTFIGVDYDLSGVGRGTVFSQPQGAIPDHGTQISGRFVMAAHHGGAHLQGPGSQFPNGEVARFYFDQIVPLSERENPANFVERKVLSNWWAGNVDGHALGGDVELSYLQSAMTSSLAVYPILLYQNQADYVGVEILFTGKATPVQGDTLKRDLRAGRGVISDAFNTYITIQTSGTYPEFCYGLGGDSGSPSFAINVAAAWGPIFVGTNWLSTIAGAVTTAAMRDAMREEMINVQQQVLSHEREVPTFFTGIFGDYDGSFAFDAADLDIIIREERMFGTRGYNWYLDLTEDFVVDDDDVDNLLMMKGFKAGDANLDGIVGSADLNKVAQNWQQTGKSWATGDFNGDGIVNAADLNIVALNWDE